MPRRIILLLVATLASVLLFASPASAHNTLLSSNPADGDVLASAPTSVTLVFGKAVPLETLTIEVIDASGVISDLVGSAYGPNGDTEVITPLPTLTAGDVTLRWRLVGPDGHPITGRVSFSIAAAATSTSVAPVATIAPAVAVPADPTTNVTSSTDLAAPAVVEPAPGADFEEPWSTPDFVRWLLRFGSYVAIMAIGGVVATTAFVWGDAWGHRRIRQAVVWSLWFTFAAALAQLLVIASDIRAVPPRDAWRGISAAFETDAGAAFAVRISLVAALAWVVFMAKRSDEWRWSLSSLLLLGLLATWAYAGHSRSMRWPVLGVPLDVAHHAAAAAWIGGLAIIGLIAVRESDLDELSQIVNRFAKVAATSVAVIVGTGVLQAIRLVGSPTRLLAADHGKYLLVKVLVLGAMLKVADINRQRVSRRFNSNGATTPRVVENLRRAMGTELAVGLMVIGVTAAMVVSPPAVSQQPTPSATAEGLSPSTSTSVATATMPSALITVPLAGCVLSGTALQIGSAGADVSCLHQALKAIGLIDNQTSDTFDTKTDAAVRSLQAQRGLVVDGIVGRVTASELGIWPS